jgi:hypothetical protein
MMANNKWKLKFSLPKNLELVMVILAFLFFIVMDASQNIAQGSTMPFETITWFGLSALVSWWVFFGLYNIALFIVFGRSLRQQATSYKYDLIFGILAFVGLLFILGAGVGAFYVTPDAPLTYMFGLAQITAYHFGIACQLIALLYFIVTD